MDTRNLFGVMQMLLSWIVVMATQLCNTWKEMNFGLRVELSGGAFAQYVWEAGF
jgi:hypothetical protein